MSQQILWLRTEKTESTARWKTSDPSEDFPEIIAFLCDTDAILNDLEWVLQINTRSLKWDHVEGIILELQHAHRHKLVKYEHRLHPSSHN